MQVVEKEEKEKVFAWTGNFSSWGKSQGCILWNLKNYSTPIYAVNIDILSVIKLQWASKIFKIYLISCLFQSINNT